MAGYYHFTFYLEGEGRGYFSKKIRFNISCKLSPRQLYFLGKIIKNKFKILSSTILHGTLSVCGSFP